MKDTPGELAPEDQAEARTIEAVESRLTELAEAIAARDSFLAVAAHELRNPMTPILAQTQRLRRIAEGSGTGNPDLVHGIRRLEALVEHYIRRATMLLDVSRMTTGKLNLHFETFDLAGLVREVGEALMPAALHTGASIAIDAPESLPVHLDRLAMEQILDNLISNAIKYGLGRPVDLHLRRGREGVVLEVRDRGVGISPRDQARIFGRFERAVSQGSSVGGFGVGLWVVGQLADAMGGRIQVRSSPGKGTTFTLHLPHHELKQA